jgi:hypothetical protein
MSEGALMNFNGEGTTTPQHEAEMAVRRRRNSRGSQVASASPRPGSLWPWALLFLFSLVGCDDGSELRWKEDVMLQDGRVITVSRRSEFRGPQEFTKAPTESYLWLELEHPTTKEKVQYETSFRHDSEEMVAFGAKSPPDPSLQHYPFALMMGGDDLYVVTRLWGRIHSFLGCPDPALHLYRWNKGRWERRPLEEIPYRKFAINLTTNPGGMRQAMKQAKYHLAADQTHRPVSGEFDLTRMTKQTFLLPPNCAECKTYESYYKGTQLVNAGPFCNRPGRNWFAREQLAN